MTASRGRRKSRFPTVTTIPDDATFDFVELQTNFKIGYLDMVAELAIKLGTGAVEGTAILSTGEGGASKFLREDGDGTCSWVLIPGGGDALTASPLSQFAATTSAQLAGVISDETGTGLAVFNTSPTLVTPALGTPASGVATNLTGTAAGLTAGAVEGTGVKSTGEAGGSKFLREDGDGTCSWQTVPGGGDALVANPLSQFAATTSAQLAATITNETGTGALVFGTSPTLVTPALGTPSSGVATNLTGTAAGLTAGNVTTNANLTGMVTSVGNAAVLGSFTTAQLNAAISDANINTPEGTAVKSTGEAGGSKFLREDGDGTCSWVAVPGGGDALVANPLSQFAATSSAQLAGVISDETGTGALVFGTSPTLVTPALGTPSSGVATNLTGTAAGLTAGNVTTNANLTGHVTSVGNAAVLGSFTTAQLNAAISDGTIADTTEIRTFDAAVSLVAGDKCRMNTAGKMDKLNASAEATTTGIFGICLETIAADDPGTFRIGGIWTTTGLTKGDRMWFSTTANTLQNSAPSTTGQQVRQVGQCLSTTELLIIPTMDYAEV